jgi:hypothetical protein
VVADPGARLPPRLGVGDDRAHLVPVTQILHREFWWQARHADRLAQRVANGGLFLAVGAELRPQLDDPRVVVEDTTLGEDVDHGRGHALADRVAKERRLGGHRTSGRGIGDARDGVDYRLAVAVDGDLQAPLGPGVDQPVDGFLDSLLDVVHDRTPPWFWPASAALFMLR